MPEAPKPVVAVTRALPGEVRVAGADVKIASARAIPRDQLLAFVRGASVLVTMFSDAVDAELLDAKLRSAMKKAKKVWGS